MLLEARRKFVQLDKKLLLCSIALLILVEGYVFTKSSWAAPRDLYYEAEACYRSLRQDPQKRKYRHNWMRCIQKFQSVYKQEPDGPWAAAGLFMSGKMYQSLSQFSGCESGCGTSA